MARFPPRPVPESQAPGDELQTGVRHSHPQPALESLVKVADLGELGPDPRSAHPAIIGGHRFRAEIPLSQGVERRLGGEHPRFHGEVDSLEPLRVQERGVVAAKEPSRPGEPGHRVVAALGYGFRAVGMERSSLEQLRDEGMPLELLHQAVRVGRGIPVVEPHDEPHGPAVLIHPVDEPAAERLRIERMAHRVDHAPLRHAALGHAPDFLDSGRVDLGRAPFLKLELRGEALGQGAPHALAEHGDLGADVRPRLEIGLPVPVTVDSLVAGPHPDHPLPFEEPFDRRHRREHVGTRGFKEPSHPLFEIAEGDDVVPVVSKRGREERESDLPGSREVEEIVARDLALDRRALLLEIGDQLLERPRIEHAARDPMRSDLGGFLEHRDRNLAEPLVLRRALVLLEELGQAQRAREARRAAAHEEDVDLEDVPLVAHFKRASSRPR